MTRYSSRSAYRSHAGGPPRSAMTPREKCERCGKDRVLEYHREGRETHQRICRECKDELWNEYCRVSHLRGVRS